MDNLIKVYLWRYTIENIHIYNTELGDEYQKYFLYFQKDFLKLIDNIIFYWWILKMSDWNFLLQMFRIESG